MAWDTIDIDSDVLAGLQEHDLRSPSGAGPVLVEPETADRARATVARLVTIKCGSLVLKRGGQVTFFDEVSTYATAPGDELYESVQEMLGFAYLHHWNRKGNLSVNSRQHELAEYYEKQLGDAVKAFCTIAPQVILPAGDKLSVRTRSVVVSSSVTYP